MRNTVKRALLIATVLCSLAGIVFCRIKTTKHSVPEVLQLTEYGEGCLGVDYKGSAYFQIAFAPESDGQALETLGNMDYDIRYYTMDRKRLWVVGYFNGKNRPRRNKGPILIWDSIRSLSIKREFIMPEDSSPYFVLEGWYVEAPYDYGVDPNPDSMIYNPTMIHRLDLKPADFKPPLKDGVIQHRGDKYGVGNF